MSEELQTAPQSDFSSKKKLIFITLGVLVILLLGGFIVVNAFPQLIFSPKMMYLNYEYKNYQNLKNDWNNYLEDSFVKDSMQVFEKPTKAETTVKFDFSNPESSDPKTLQIYSLLKNSQLKLSQYTDIKNEKDKSTIAVKLNNSDFLTLNTFSSQNKMGISLSPIYDKYITFDKNNLKDIYEKLQINDGPSKIISSYDLLKILKLSSKDQEYIKSKFESYGKIIVDSIDKNDVTFTSKVPVTVDGVSVNTRLLSLKLDNQKLRNIYIKILENISNDDKLLNMTVGKYADLLNLYKDANYSIDEELVKQLKDIDSTKKLLADTIADLKEVSDNTGNLTVNIYVDKNSTTVKREIKLVQDDTAVVSYDYAKVLEPKTDNYKISSNIKTSSSQQEESSISITGYENKSEQNLKVSAVDKDNKNTKFDIVRTFSKNKGLDLKLNFKTDNDAITMSYKLNKNTKDNSLNSIIEVVQNKDNKVVINSNVKYNSPFELPDVSSNELDLNKTSVSDLQQEFTKIYLSGLSFMQRNSQLFN